MQTESQSEQLDPKVEIQNEDSVIHLKGKEPVLTKYVRQHHIPSHILGDKSKGTMTRSKLKGKCLLAEFESRSVWKLD